MNEDLRFVNWRLLISYRGTNYAGWQCQDGIKTVEQTLREALERITKQRVPFVVAGRTDSGVHARGQVVSCKFSSRFDGRKLILALGTALPEDIAVWRADEMPLQFNARRHSIGKRYVYRINQALAKDPFLGRIAWHIRRPLSINAMNEAARLLIGEKDYESFRSKNCSAEHARRYVWHIEITNESNQVLAIDIRGNAFCHNMVRIIVGTLVEVGLGRIEPAFVSDILLARDRTKAFRTAPAQGLSLEEVYYPDDLSGAMIPDGAEFPRFPLDDDLIALFAQKDTEQCLA